MLKLKNRSEFGKLLNELGLLGWGIEVGVAYGENAKAILDEWKGEGMNLIDPYKQWGKDEYVDGSRDLNWEGCLNYAKNLLEDHKDRIMWVRETSDDAYQMFHGGYDFVYIDGNHHQPQIGRDLENYWNLVREGGIFCGHDYYDLDTPEYRCDVKSAVDDFVAKRGLELTVTEECLSWWIQKT